MFNVMLSGRIFVTERANKRAFGILFVYADTRNKSTRFFIQSKIVQYRYGNVKRMQYKNYDKIK